MFRKALERGIKKDVMISDFRAAGLYPWNPDHVDMTKLGPSQLYSTATDETETLPPMTTGLVTGTTETDIPTVTDVQTVTPMTVTDNLAVTATADVHDDLPDDPPSPTVYPSALPPLSPLPSLSSDIPVTVPSSSIVNLSSATVTPVVSSLSSSSQVPSSSNCIATNFASSSSSSSLTDNMATKEALDRLLDVTAKAGFDKLVRYRTLHSLGLKLTTLRSDCFVFCIQN